MDVEIPVLAGHLIVPTQTGFSINRISKKKSTNHKYCQLFKASRHGIERLEIGDKEDDKNPKIITLENCVKITQEPSPANLIHVVTKTGTLTLNTLTDDDLKLWLAALQNVAFKDKAGGTLTNRNSVIEEDNDLYCTSYSDGIFTVRLLPSDICTKCHLEAKQYVLHLTATDLQLKLTTIDNSNSSSAIVIAKWPYRYIRKYGYRDGKFTFEAGRKCDTGEGVFSLEHINPQEIFRCMAAKMKSMKNLISGADSIVSLDCGEHQFNAALSMEAGSRSPLPPSPNLHSHSKSDLSQSGHLLRGFLSSNDSLNNSSIISTTSTSIPLLSSTSTSSSTSLSAIVKHIPNKPPRKSMTTIENNVLGGGGGVQQKYTKFQNYDIVTPPSTTENTVKMTTSTSSAILLKPLPSTESINGSQTTSTNNSNSNINSNNSNKTIVNLVVNNNNNQSESKNNVGGEKPPELPVRNESKASLLDDRDYESIQIITNAWITRGIDDIKHTEHVSSSVDENFTEFIWQRSQSKDNIPISMPLSPKNSNHSTEYDRKLSQTNDNKSNSIDNYDRLQFFGATSKTSNDYKTIVTITPPGMNKNVTNFHSTSSSNDYEIIGGGPSDMQPCRLADDSYMGYGVIRQTISSSPSNISTTAIATPAQAILSDDELLDHRKYNGLDYAIVSKPKRV